MNKLQSKQDYLERILMLCEKQDLVRAIDIANSMNYSKPSVSIALKKLKNDGYICKVSADENLKDNEIRVVREEE